MLISKLSLRSFILSSLPLHTEPHIATMTRKKPHTTSAKKPSAAFFAALPQALQLACLTMLRLKDMLYFSATCRTMYTLCADDVLWRPINEDLVRRCRLPDVHIVSLQEPWSLEIHKKQVEEQAKYKHKTFLHLLAIFRQEKGRAVYFVNAVYFGQVEYTYDVGIKERAAEDKINRLGRCMKALRNAVKKHT